MPYNPLMKDEYPDFALEAAVKENDRIKVVLEQLGFAHVHFADYEDGYPGLTTNGEINDVLYRDFLEVKDMPYSDFQVLLPECDGAFDKAKRVCDSIGGNCWAH